MKEDKLTKTDIIDEIYEKLDLSKKDILAVTDALLSIIKNNILEKIY